MAKAWDKYKGLLRKCPHHEIPRWLQVNQFYNGLNSMSRAILDASARGLFLKKNEMEAYEILEDTTNNNTLWQSERLQPIKKVARIHDLDVFTNLAAQVSLLMKQL